MVALAQTCPPSPVTESQLMAETARVFDVAQLLGLSAEKINSLRADEFKLLVFDQRFWRLGTPPRLAPGLRISPRTGNSQTFADAPRND